MTQPSRDLREQLGPIAARLREGHAVIRPVSQVTLCLKSTTGRDRFATTIDDILRWMNRRAGRTLPPEAWERGSFELSEIGAQRTAAVSLNEPRYWAARLDDADKSVPLRTWVTEIGVGINPSGDTLFGARLICTTRGADEPFDRSIPGFVKAVIAAGRAEHDGEPLTKGPRVVSSQNDVAALVRLLESPARLSEVIVFALPDDSTNIAETVASAEAVHQLTLGAAHVFVITGPASFMLTERIGRELSVFRQAVRTYRPKFHAAMDQPSDHPLALPGRILEWHGIGPAAFERWIVNHALAASVGGIERDQRLPPFNTVRSLAAQAERERLRGSGGSDAEISELYKQDNENLRKELVEQKEQNDSLLLVADADLKLAIQAAIAARSLAYERLQRIRVLEQRFAQSTVVVETPIPDSLDGFEEWCREHLVGTVALLGRAFQGVRKSEYHDPSYIYRALLLLRDHYVPMRVEGTLERRNAYLKALEELQLEESPTGEAADDYAVQYGGAKHPLDKHLKGGNSREPRFGFRLYFFWDEDEQVVVVGWLPSHLDNRAS